MFIYNKRLSKTVLYSVKSNLKKKFGENIKNKHKSNKEKRGLKKYKLKEDNKKKKKRIKFFLFINLTVNNLFAHVYDFYLGSVKRRKRYKSGFKVISISCGLSEYFGKARLSNIALETTGQLFAEKLVMNKIFWVNLVLSCRLNRKIKEFLKGLLSKKIIKIKKILFFPKLAHNGCRLRAKKRL